MRIPAAMCERVTAGPSSSVDGTRLRDASRACPPSGPTPLFARLPSALLPLQETQLPTAEEHRQKRPRFAYPLRSGELLHLDVAVPAATTGQPRAGAPSAAAGSDPTALAVTTERPEAGAPRLVTRLEPTVPATALDQPRAGVPAVPAQSAMQPRLAALPSDWRDVVQRAESLEEAEIVEDMWAAMFQEDLVSEESDA